MIVVGKHINDITINPLEYLLDDKGEIKEFLNEDEAKAFLKEQGVTDEDIEWFVFKDTSSPEYIKQELFDIIDNAVASAGYKVLDGDRDSVIVRRIGSQLNDCDYVIKITDIPG